MIANKFVRTDNQTRYGTNIEICPHLLSWKIVWKDLNHRPHVHYKKLFYCTPLEEYLSLKNLTY